MPVDTQLLLCVFIFQLNRPAHELLMSVALNCNTHSLEDVEVISNIIKMRLKTKQLAGHYITCVRYSVLILFNKQTNQLGKKKYVGFRFPDPT